MLHYNVWRNGQRLMSNQHFHECEYWKMIEEIVSKVQAFVHKCLQGEY